MRYISSFVRIRKNDITLNNQKVDVGGIRGGEELIRHFYKDLALDYPKFYKMDLLCKTAWLGVELLRKHTKTIADYSDHEIALFLSNSESCIDSDVAFQKSYVQEHSPSPALFVYTLPNIMAGEIAIRNKWFGENLVTIMPSFDATYFSNQCTMSQSNDTKAAVCGWVNTEGGILDVLIFFASDTDEHKLNLNFTNSVLNSLYLI